MDMVIFDHIYDIILEEIYDVWDFIVGLASILVIASELLELELCDT